MRDLRLSFKVQVVESKTATSRDRLEEMLLEQLQRAIDPVLHKIGASSWSPVSIDYEGRLSDAKTS